VEKAPDNQVITYEAPWVIYALGFSSKGAYPYRLGIGSFVEDVRNEVEIIQLNLDTQLFETRAKFVHNYPATKLIWLPEKVAVFSSRRKDLDQICSLRAART
jgi:WD repeat-containing protein 68